MTHLHQQLPRLFLSVIVAATVGCRGTDAIGPSTGGTLATAAGTASLILDGEVPGFMALPGLSATVTVAAGKAGDVLIETDGGIQVNSFATDAVCATDVAIFVDGAQLGSGRRELLSNTKDVLFNVGTYGFSVATELSAGAHTITVRAKPYTAFAAVPCHVSSGADGSDLPGRPHLQAVLNVVSF